MKSGLLLLGLATGIILGPRCGRSAEPDELIYVPNSTQRVCQLTGDLDRATGKPTLSRTDEHFGVWGTDLGSSFMHGGKLFFLFGDTVGRPGSRDVLAWTESKDPARIVLHFYKAADGKWLPLTVPGIGQGAFEVPSGGVSIGAAMYVVCTTDHSEAKVMGRSVVARSNDEGRTFKLLYDLSHMKFINVAFWPTAEWLYLYGSGEYRKSNVCLARVRPHHFEDRSKLEYFQGPGGEGRPRWSPREEDAVPLFHQLQVGEFSVKHLKPVNRYVMLYNAAQPRGITMRSAPEPWGPWSEGTVIFEPGRDKGYGHFMHISSKAEKNADNLSDPGREQEWGGEYGPYIIAPFTVEIEGRCRIFYTMSTWNPYEVMVMRSDLKLATRPTE
jgi:uncharacterized protein DUF4185